MAADSRYIEMLAAGQRLLLAMRDEEECSALYYKERSPETLANWVRARAAIETQAKNDREARLASQSTVELTPAACVEPLTTA
jgi:hypothetical protein